MNIDIKAITETLKGAGTVYFVTGTGKSAGGTALKASEKFGNITNAKVNITAGRKIALEVALGELVEASRCLVKNSAPEAQVIWGYMIDEAMSENVRVSVFAAMNDKNSATQDRSLLQVYNNLKHKEDCKNEGHKNY